MPNTAPSTSMTPGPQAISLSSGTAKSIMAVNTLRTGAVITNATVSAIYIGVGAPPTLTPNLNFTKRIEPGGSWELPPFGITQEIWAIASVAIAAGAGVSVTEFTQ